MRREYRAENLPDFFYAMKGCTDWATSIWLAINGKIRFINECMSTYRYWSCAHSFMAKNQDPRNPNLALMQDIIDMLKGVRPYLTKACDQNSLEEAILKKEYDLLNYQHRYSQMRRGPYKKLYQQESIKEKLKLFIKQYFPKIVEAYKNRQYER